MVILEPKHASNHSESVRNRLPVEFPSDLVPKKKFLAQKHGFLWNFQILCTHGAGREALRQNTIFFVTSHCRELSS